MRAACCDWRGLLYANLSHLEFILFSHSAARFFLVCLSCCVFKVVFLYRSALKVRNAHEFGRLRHRVSMGSRVTERQLHAGKHGSALWIIRRVPDEKIWEQGHQEKYRMLCTSVRTLPTDKLTPYQRDRVDCCLSPAHYLDSRALCLSTCTALTGGVDVTHR